MARPTFKRTLEEVLNHKSIFIDKTTEDGKSYQVELIPAIKVVAITEPQRKSNGSYSYSIVDRENSLEYSISCDHFVAATFGTALEFKNVTGGQFNNLVWFKADNVALDLDAEVTL